MLIRPFIGHPGLFAVAGHGHQQELEEIYEVDEQAERAKGDGELRGCAVPLNLMVGQLQALGVEGDQAREDEDAHEIGDPENRRAAQGEVEDQGRDQAD